ncbi:MAG: tRNA pseudouridine(55) synthase TruB [Deltaproteobacteria bacterium]|nr:tRNA pseudouridine(55) synthase TruB [Deltaproteobacteria bacterium]MBW2192282.1 tRNA pseudouridine(55) synthase TruB [Deltaproteobacteria bacterium]
MQQEICGVIVIDKPANITSARVVAIVKKLFRARKVGHTGTLDPFATGVMVCCINRATRLASFFLHGNKRYRAVLHLGVTTDTQDLTGNVVSTCDEVDFSETEIRSVVKKFSGVIEQLPPVYSALKHKGVPLYKLARDGKPVQKPPRRVSISYIEILEINLPLVYFEVLCSAGTYIRTLCADIGASLGCGGHLKELRRIENSGYAIEEAVTLTELEELARSGEMPNRVIPMAGVLRDMPEHVADQDLKEQILNGSIITKADIVPEQDDMAEGFIKIVDTDNALIAVLNILRNSDRVKYCCVFN